MGNYISKYTGTQIDNILTDSKSFLDNPKDVIDESIQNVIIEPSIIDGGNAEDNFPENIQLNIGNPEDLTTESKQVVGAINEVKAENARLGQEIDNELTLKKKMFGDKWFYNNEIHTKNIVGQSYLATSDFNTVLKSITVIVDNKSADGGNNWYIRAIGNIPAENIFLKVIEPQNQYNSWLMYYPGLTRNIFGCDFGSYRTSFSGTNKIEYIEFINLRSNLDLGELPNLTQYFVNDFVKNLPTTGNAYTINLHEITKAKFSEEQINTVINKGWTIA